jgi:bla regulator protein blaR1
MLFLWGIYKLVLENEKTHRFNRFYLLFSLFVSFAIPFFNFEIKTSFIQNEAIQEVVKIPNQTFLKEKLPDNQLVEVYSSQKWTGLRATEVSSKTFDLTRVLFFIWAFVSTVLLLRFAKNLFEIYQKIQRNERVFYQSSTIVLLKEAVLPCTFMQYIFVQKEDFDNQQFEPELLQHEQCHVQQLHTLDVILLEVFQVLFWFNPVVYLFKNAIKLNHEFLADDAVNQQNKDIPFYQRLLLTKAMAGNLQLTSSSTFQLTKQRLIMMTKHTSATVATLKIMLTVALTALIALGFSSRLSAQKQETKKNSLPVKQENKKATTAPTQKTKLPP